MLPVINLNAFSEEMASDHCAVLVQMDFVDDDEENVLLIQ